MKRQEKAGTPVPTSKDSEQPLIGGCGLSPEKAETAEPMLPLEASPTSPSEPNADGRIDHPPQPPPSGEGRRCNPEARTL